MAQKARNDKTLDKYQKLVREEADRPANKFLDWIRLIDPYTDAVISAKVTDYELIKLYESYTKEMITHESKYVNSESTLNDSLDNVDAMINTIIKLEQRVLEVKKHFAQELTNLRMKTIQRYNKLPESQKFDDDEHCTLCGNEMENNEVDDHGTCFNCQRLPRAYLEKMMPEIVTEEPEESTEEDTSIQEDEATEESVEEDTEKATEEAEPEPPEPEPEPEPKLPPVPLTDAELAEKNKKDLLNIVGKMKKVYKEGEGGKMEYSPSQKSEKEA